MRRTTPLLLALVLAFLPAGCVPAAEDRLQQQIAEDVELRAIQDRGVLRVGIPTGPRGLGQAEPEDGGFAEEIAAWVAEALGVRTEFTYGSTEEILIGVHDRDLDLAFPVMPITEGTARSKKRSYTAPYFVAHQRILLGPEVQDLEAVGKVCVFGDARTQIPPANVRSDIQAVRSNDAAGCGRLVTTGIVDAVFAPDLLMFELEDGLPDSTMLDDAYNTEGYSAVVQYGQIGVANFFDAVLSHAIDDGRWTDAYDNHLAGLTSLDAEPPSLTAEEAAALFPRGLSLVPDDQG